MNIRTAIVELKGRAQRLLGKLTPERFRLYRRHLSLAQKIVGTLTGIITIVGAIYSVYLFFSPAPTPDKGRMEAVIQDNSSGDPLTGAKVDILSTDKALIATLETDHRGRVTYDLKDGRYNLRISSQGYNGTTREVQVTPGQNAEITVRLSSTLAPVKGLQNSMKKVFGK